ncbi:hypothetical protein Slala03_81190 [Streptomyces lavendulae subsp. lavendulae]|nr:hypothetical protein Slala03_81190 [Streptomyces lavendulae subsp. lavendulae]
MNGRGRGGGTSLGAGGGAAQGGLFAVDEGGEFGEGLLGPVVGELVVVGVGEVVGGGVGEEGLGEVEADTEAAGVHRHFQYRCGGRGRVSVAVEEFGGAGEVLGDPPASARTAEGVGEKPVPALGESGRGGQRRSIERLGNGQHAAGQQLPYPAVRIFPSRRGQGCVPGGVLGPERAQHQDRPAFRPHEQLVHGSRDPLARRVVAEVVLGLVQPHHGARRDTRQVLQSVLGAGRVEGVPQPPPLRRERLHGLPARPRLPRRRTAHQHHGPTTAGCGVLDQPGQYPVMLAPHISGHRPGPRPPGPGGVTGRVDLQVVRIPLTDRTARHRPHPTPGALHRAPLQLQQFLHRQPQRTGQGRHRLGRGGRLRRRERLRHRRAPQPGTPGEIRLVHPHAGHPAPQPLPQLHQRRILAVMFVVHGVCPPGPSCSPVFIFLPANPGEHDFRDLRPRQHPNM